MKRFFRAVGVVAFLIATTAGAAWSQSVENSDSDKAVQGADGNRLYFVELMNAPISDGGDAATIDAEQAAFRTKANQRPTMSVKDALEAPRRDTGRVVLPPASYVHEKEKIEKRWPAAVKFIKERGMNEFVPGDIADVLVAIGLFKIRGGEEADGRKHLERALLIFEKVYGPKHSKTIETRKKLEATNASAASR